MLVLDMGRGEIEVSHKIKELNIAGPPPAALSLGCATVNVEL